MLVLSIQMKGSYFSSVCRSQKFHYSMIRFAQQSFLQHVSGVSDLKSQACLLILFDRFSFNELLLSSLSLDSYLTYCNLKGQSHEMIKALFKYGLIGLGQERNC
jgi:hypothetical protein